MVRRHSAISPSKKKTIISLDSLGHEALMFSVRQSGVLAVAKGTKAQCMQQENAAREGLRTTTARTDGTDMDTVTWSGAECG